MRVLVINCGSSSVKVSVYDQALQKHIFSHKAERLGTTDARVLVGEQTIDIPNGDHKQALEKLVQFCSEDFDAIVHRVACVDALVGIAE